MKRTVHRKASRGFTLIELLVSISIVSLLIAMLLPALASARQAARRVQCAAQQSQVGVSLHLYAGDYRDQLPRLHWREFIPSQGDVRDQTWFLAIVAGEYVQVASGRTLQRAPGHAWVLEAGVLACPDADYRYGYVVHYTSPVRRYGTSYAMNAQPWVNRERYWDTTINLENTGGLDLDAVRQPASGYLLTDGNQYGVGPGTSNQYGIMRPHVGRVHFEYRHQSGGSLIDGSANTLHFDNHVESLTWDVTRSSASDVQWHAGTD